MDIDTSPSKCQGEQGPSSSNAQEWTLVPPPVLPNFGHVCKNIRMCAAGIFDPPKPHHSSSLSESTDWFPPLPPRTDFAHLSRSYVAAVHQIYPVLHWPMFESRADQVYRTESFEGTTKAWIGIYFAVLACGCLGTNTAMSQGYKGGTELYEIASQAMNPWPQNPGMEHARLLLLLSVFATENGMASAGSMWLACAARIAQTLSLNHPDPAESVYEAEMRSRLWWAIYVQDRCVVHFKMRQLLTRKG